MGGPTITAPNPNIVFLPVYNLGLGKAALWLSQRLHLLSMAVYSQEKRGLRPSCFPAKYSKALATLGLNQLPKLERFNAHRKIIAQIYFKELADTDLKLPPKSEGDIYLRFTVDSPRCRGIVFKAKLERKWVLGDWYRMETHFLNLPTYPSFLKSDALELCNQLKIWLKTQEINNKEQWESFVLERPEANFLQSWNWGEFHSQLGHTIYREGDIRGFKIGRFVFGNQRKSQKRYLFNYSRRTTYRLE